MSEEAAANEQVEETTQNEEPEIPAVSSDPVDEEPEVEDPSPAEEAPPAVEEEVEVQPNYEKDLSIALILADGEAIPPKGTLGLCCKNV